MLSEKRIFAFKMKNVSLTLICGIGEQIWTQFTDIFLHKQWSWKRTMWSASLNSTWTLYVCGWCKSSSITNAIIPILCPVTVNDSYWLSENFFSLVDSKISNVVTSKYFSLHSPYVNDSLNLLYTPYSPDSTPYPK